jgi:hypothetical protein
MNENKSSQYEQAGVDPLKKKVREIFGKVVDNDFVGAFVNVIADFFSSRRVVTQHQDGDGSKPVQKTSQKTGKNC